MVNPRSVGDRGPGAAEIPQARITDERHADLEDQEGRSRMREVEAAS
jgi:hypothetical protein